MGRIVPATVLHHDREFRENVSISHRFFEQFQSVDNDAQVCSKSQRSNFDAKADHVSARVRAGMGVQRYFSNP
jgi:hypothetical protein